jgi:hypothetical protein
MGQIGEVIKTEKSTLDDGSELVDVVVDPGGGANLKIAHFADAGDDSKPLPGDFCASEDGGEGTGTQQSTGYHDAKNASKSAEGEKRIYSRTPAGLPAAEIWLKKDGTVAGKRSSIL